jgi:cytochrome c oxidase subunit 3
LWFTSESALPTYTVNEVAEGLRSNPNILIRTEQINEAGEKTLLSRPETLERIKDAKYVVEGANLVRNEYGSRLLPISSFSSLVFTVSTSFREL